MSKTLFMGDSHLAGYQTIPGKIGPGSYSLYNDNSFAEQYATLNDKEVIVYCVAGTANMVYPDWLKSMFEKHNDIDEVHILLAAFNRFVIAFNKTLLEKTIKVDHFTTLAKEKPLVKIYSDGIIVEDSIQLFNKPIKDDYDKFVGFEFSPEQGLVKPDLRKQTFMECKLFYDLNTHIEHRNFYKDIYTMDNICADNNAKLYLSVMRSRSKHPVDFNYYGDLKATTIASQSIEDYMKSNDIDPNKHFLDDEEHYDTEYHKAIAENYIPWIKKF